MIFLPYTMAGAASDPLDSNVGRSVVNGNTIITFNKNV